MSDDETPTPTPRYRQVLDASAELARELGHSYIGVEHLFLAIVRDQAAVPIQVLARITDLDRVEASVREEMASPGYTGEPAGGICQPVRGTVRWLLLSGGFFLLGRVDPGCAWQFRRGWRFAGEAFGVGVVGGVQDLGAAGLDGCGASVVDVGGVQAEPAVAVLVVVPGEEVLAVRPGGLDRGGTGRGRPAGT